MYNLCVIEVILQPKRTMKFDVSITGGIVKHDLLLMSMWYDVVCDRCTVLGCSSNSAVVLNTASITIMLWISIASASSVAVSLPDVRRDQA
jgi:uncharacterized membrane protein